MWKEGVLENNLILPVLKRVRVSPHVGPSIDVEAEREAKNKEQGGGRLHLGRKGWRQTLKAKETQRPEPAQDIYPRGVDK